MPIFVPGIPRPAGTDAVTAQVPDSTATGGNARGANAVDWQTSRTAATQVASGASSTIGGGQNNTASNISATVAGGDGNTASGFRSTVGGGFSCVADGQYSWVPGGFYGSTRGGLGRGAWAAGRFSATGDAQAGEFVLRKQTTDATASRLTADGAASATATNTVNLPANATYLVRILVAARQTGGGAGTAGDSVGWVVDALVKRGLGAASTTLVGGGGASIAPTYNDTAAAAWRLTVAADTTQGGIAVSGTGEASKNINWVARVLSVECVG